MTKVFLLAICMLSAAANAQESPKPVKEKKVNHEKSSADRAQKQLETISTELTLTAEQKPKVYEVLLAKINKADEIRVKYKNQPEGEEKKKELISNRKQFHQNMKPVLTPEQLKLWKTKQQERKATGKETTLDKD